MRIAALQIMPASTSGAIDGIPAACVFTFAFTRTTPPNLVPYLYAEWAVIMVAIVGGVPIQKRRARPYLRLLDELDALRSDR